MRLTAEANYSFFQHIPAVCRLLGFLLVLCPPQLNFPLSVAETHNNTMQMISSLCYSCFNSTAPVYPTNLLTVYEPTQQLCYPSDTSIFCLPSSSLYVHALTWSDLFLLLHRLSGIVSLAKLDCQAHSHCQTDSHLLNHL